MPLKKATVKRIKRRRLGELLPPDDDEDREAMEEGEELEELEDGVLIPESKRLMPAGDDDGYFALAILFRARGVSGTLAFPVSRVSLPTRR